MKKIFIWVVRLTAAVILLQTLFFKFSGASESIYIFSTLGAEPYGRIGSGIAELIAAILILIPRTTFFGAAIGAGIMLGAILSHVLILGIDVQNDGGTLFILAMITFICCIRLLVYERQTFTKLVKNI